MELNHLKVEPSGPWELKNVCINHQKLGHQSTFIHELVLSKFYHGRRDEIIQYHPCPHFSHGFMICGNLQNPALHFHVKDQNLNKWLVSCTIIVVTCFIFLFMDTYESHLCIVALNPTTWIRDLFLVSSLSLFLLRFFDSGKLKPKSTLSP